MAFYNTTLSQSLNDRYYKYSEIREIYRNHTNQIQSVGFNLYGALGDGTTTDRTFLSPSTIIGNWLRISASTIAGPSGAIDSRGYLWMWGQNIHGELGQNDRVHRSSPVQVGSDRWSEITARTYVAYAIRSDGTLWGWGANDYGQLAQLTDTIHRSSPVQIGTSSWTQISAGTGSLGHATAIRADGTLWSWGANFYGELGANQTFGMLAGRSSPGQIGTGSSWLSVNSGYYRSFAIRNDGTLWGWGFNPGYELGDNTQIHRSSPVQITAADGTVSFTQVSSTHSHALALSTTGRVYAWGRNVDGECGLGVANTSVTQPSPITATGTYTQVQAGDQGSTILRSDGIAFWFGDAPNGNDGYRSSPVQINSTRYRLLSHNGALLLLKE